MLAWRMGCANVTSAAPVVQTPPRKRFMRIRVNTRQSRDLHNIILLMSVQID